MAIIKLSIHVEKYFNLFSCLPFFIKVLLTNILFLSYSSAETLNEKQTLLFMNNCVQCHSIPATGAPIIGIESDWVAIKAKGEDKILNNVLQGVRGMPPLGYCSACSKDDFKVLIRLMTNMNGNQNISKGDK